MNKFFYIIVLLLIQLHNSFADVRIKDIALITSANKTNLYGYGLVVGLQGTGDSIRNIPYTEQSLQSMLDHLGVNIKSGQIRAKNIASVIVTADVDSDVAIGSKIDIKISSLGDAYSLSGGSLLYTLLNSADNKIIASAQGQLSVSGIAAAGQAETISVGVATVGSISGGAVIKKNEIIKIPSDRNILELINPDNKTAINIVDTINEYTLKTYSQKTAFEESDRYVTLVRPKNTSLSRFISNIGELRIVPDIPAHVVIDTQSGTIVIGKDVTLSKVAITQGNINIKISETPIVSQPNSFSNGNSVTVPRTDIQIDQGGEQIAQIEGPTLSVLVKGLNSLGVKPLSLIPILQTLKASGALQADIIMK